MTAAVVLESEDLMSLIVAHLDPTPIVALGSVSHNARTALRAAIRGAPDLLVRAAGNAGALTTIKLPTSDGGKGRSSFSLFVDFGFFCGFLRGVGGALLRRLALNPTALHRLRCVVWVDSTSCSSDDADDPYFMTAVSRLTPCARPADQSRTASIAPPHASADGRDGAERPAHQAGLVACATRTAD